MGKPVGSPKTGGRKKGTPNAKFWGFLEVLQSRGIEPLGEILDELQRLSGPDKIKVYIDLLPYLYPKRKPTETPPISINEYLDSLKMQELMTLLRDIRRRVGDNQPISSLSIDQLKYYKETFERALRDAELLKVIGSGEDC